MEDRLAILRQPPATWLDDSAAPPDAALRALLAQRSAGRVAPPAMSGMHSAYTPLGDAPGAYVAMK
jgi:hypothetical protein